MKHPLCGCAASPCLAAREGDATSGLAWPVPRWPRLGPRPLNGLRAAHNAIDQWGADGILAVLAHVSTP